VNLLIDAQLPPALATWLTEQGHTAQHVDDLGLRESDDVVIWNHELKDGAIIVTKDEDFAERTGRTSIGPKILWLRIGNSTNQVLLKWLEPRWLSIVARLDAGDRLIEVR
jgi:predicted nuclease of predicted toxin-antitoxin system